MNIGLSRHVLLSADSYIIISEDSGKDLNGIFPENYKGNVDTELA